MTEMKTMSFWKSLEVVLAGARLPDTQMTNPWPIVKLEGLANVPARLPRRSAPADRPSEDAGRAVATTPPAARMSAVTACPSARPPPQSLVQ